MDGGETTRSSREPSGQSEAEKRIGMGIEEEGVTMEMLRHAGGEHDVGDADSTNYSTPRRRSATSNKTWVFDAGDPLSCVAISNLFPLIAIAGRNLLQVLRVDGDRFVSVHRVTNLQRNISSSTTVNTSKLTTSSAATTASASGTGSTTSTHFQPPRSYAINDVAWSNTKSVLATCSNAGDLIIWDLSRGITQNVCFVGHSRSVHRIHFNPNSPNEIISASHDGTVKLFDVRDQSCRQIFHVRTTAPSPVRDVVYCPREGHTLAAAFENGLVCIWDTRNENQPARCFQAHNSVTASIDWHPMWNSSDRNWLATAGGRDNTIKVWDLNKTSPTAAYSLRSKNTGHVRWRVGEPTQLVSSCSLSLDLSIHLWELNRPYIPYITFEGHSHTISGIAWSTEPNTFYSVARDGLLVRHYVGDGVQTVRLANSVALAFNCRGPLAHAVGGEPGQRVLGGGTARRASPVRTASAARGQRVSLTQRVVPPTVVEAPHTITATRTPHQLLVTRRYLLPPNDLLSLDLGEEGVSLTPVEAPANIIPPEDFIAQSQSELFVADFILEKSTEQYAPISSLLLPDTFMYLAKNYRISGNSVEEVCDHNAAVARHVNQDFLSQFWLTLKMFLSHSWQSSPAATAKASPRTSTNSQRREVERRDQHPPTPASRSRPSPPRETSHPHSAGVCVLDFIPQTGALEETVDRGALNEATASESETGKENSVVSAAGAVGGVAAASSAPPAPTPSTAPSNHHHHQQHQHQQQQPPSSAPEADSLGHSVNFLFADDNGGGSGGSRLLHSDADPPRNTALIGISSLPAETDVFFGETSATNASIFSTAATAVEEEQQPQAPVVRKSSFLESNRKPDARSSADESTGSQKKPRELRDASGLDEARSSVRLNLTSSSDCVEAVDPALVAKLTRPLDFLHLVGAWLLELIEAGHAQSVCTALLILGTERTRINEWASEKQIETWFYAYLDVLVRFRLWSVSTRIIKHCGSTQGVVLVAPPAPGSGTVGTPTSNAASTVVSTPCGVESAQQGLLPRRRSSSAKPPSTALPLARHIAILNQTGTSVSVRCGKCSKPLQRSAAVAAAAASVSASATSPGAPAAAASTSHAAWACARHPSAETALSTCAVCHMTVRGIYLWCVGCSHGGHLDHIREWITRRPECPAGCGHYCEYGKLDGRLYLQISA